MKKLEKVSLLPDIKVNIYFEANKKSKNDQNLNNSDEEVKIFF